MKPIAILILVITTLYAQNPFGLGAATLPQYIERPVEVFSYTSRNLQAIHFKHLLTEKWYQFSTHYFESYALWKLEIWAYTQNSVLNTEIYICRENGYSIDFLLHQEGLIPSHVQTVQLTEGAHTLNPGIVKPQKIKKKITDYGKAFGGKPIIYLYPTDTIPVTVILDSAITPTFTYPQYPSQGWRVTAYPDGTLKDSETGKRYYSLFWEGIYHTKKEIDSGFVVSAHEVVPFLEEKLEILGLNFREAQEFILYWAPKLEQNSYSVIHFSTDRYDQEVPLEIIPRPDTQIRIMMEYRHSDHWFELPEQNLKSPKREGFTAVEWGGTNLDDCSHAIQ